MQRFMEIGSEQEYGAKYADLIKFVPITVIKGLTAHWKDLAKRGITAGLKHT